MPNTKILIVFAFTAACSGGGGTTIKTDASTRDVPSGTGQVADAATSDSMVPHDSPGSPDLDRRPDVVLTPDAALVLDTPVSKDAPQPLTGACTISGVLAPATTICRPAAGVCDKAEYCDGVHPDCPADMFFANGTTCREALNTCDIAEFCSGTSADCPPDQFQGVTVACNGIGHCSGGIVCIMPTGDAGISDTSPPNQLDTAVQPDSPQVLPEPGPDAGPDVSEGEVDAATQAPGTMCTSGSQCASNLCEQGVCCRTSCTGICQSCALAGSMGTCTNIPAGQDPLNQCPDQGKASCGSDGWCDGAGACQLYPSGSVCIAQTCANGTETSASTCDGLGICHPGTSRACAPSQCSSAGTACNTTCSDNGQCVAPNTCNSGHCGLKASGATCTAANQCSSGFCEQGVCCLTACSGTCLSCAIAANVGACSNVPAGQDPLNQCADQGAASCGADGACNGNGACRLYSSGTACTAPFCTGGVASPAGACTGTGACHVGSATSCSPYVACAGVVCASNCALSTECVPPNTCNGGVCSKKGQGATCSAAAQCASGYCEQGVCCATACSGTCRSCAVAGPNLGTCSNVPNGQDPWSHCTTDASSTCGKDGTCDGNGACRLYSAATICAAQSCAAGVQTSQRTCSGMGSCPVGVSRSCSPYVCNSAAIACLLACTGNADCEAPGACTGGTCGVAAWPMLGGGQQHTGRSSHVGAQSATQKWTFTTGGNVAPAVVDSGGIIYVHAHVDNNLHALNPDGTEKWTWTTGTNLTDSSGIGPDGTVYVGGNDGVLYAVNPDGTQKWTFSTNARADISLDSSPTIDASGTIYISNGVSPFASASVNVFAVNPDGSQKWVFTVTGVSAGDGSESPGIAADGTVYASVYYLYAINPDGTQKWIFNGNYMTSSPAIGADGTIYVGTGSPQGLVAVNPNGTQKWFHSLAGAEYGAPAIAADGTIYAASLDKKLHAINLNGTERWAFTTGDQLFSSPAIGADGIIYVGSYDKNVYAVKPDGTQKWAFATGSYVVASPAIGADGTVYIGSADQKIYAIGP